MRLEIKSNRLIIKIQLTSKLKENKTVSVLPTSFSLVKENSTSTFEVSKDKNYYT